MIHISALIAVLTGTDKECPEESKLQNFRMSIKATEITCRKGNHQFVLTCMENPSLIFMIHNHPDLFIIFISAGIQQISGIAFRGFDLLIRS
jgi:hypothetical protein